MRHLEQLVNTLATSREVSGSASNGQNNAESSNGSLDGFSSNLNSSSRKTSEAHDDQKYAIKPEKMLAGSDQTVYISGTHWASLCNEVAEMRDILGHDDALSITEVGSRDNDGGSLLLEGIIPRSDISTISDQLPSRDVADRLVTRYFSATEYAIVVLHAPVSHLCGDLCPNDFRLKPRRLSSSSTSPSGKASRHFRSPGSACSSASLLMVPSSS